MVPLALIAKGDVRDLDTSGPDGTPLPVLTKEENGALSYLALVYQMTREIGPLDEGTLAQLWAIVFSPPDEAAFITGLMLPRGATADAIADDSGLSGQLIDLLRDLSQNFLLVVLVPQALVGTRTVLKYSFDWTAEPTNKSLIRDALAGGGYTSREFDLDVGDPAWAASYHLEVRVQPPLVAKELCLPPLEKGGEPASRASGAGTLVHGSASYRDAPVVDRTATLLVRVEARSTRMVAILVSLFTAVVFLSEQNLHGAQDALLAANDGAVAILLSVPAVAIALLAGVGESRLAASVLRPVRAATLSCAGLLAIGSATLVGHLREPYISHFWHWGSVFASAVATFLFIPVIKMTGEYVLGRFKRK